MAVLFYNFFIYLYGIGARLLAPFNPKAKLWLNGRKKMFARVERQWRELQKTPNRGPVIWMHCASLGEFEQGRPVIEGLRQHNRPARIIITFFSPSGYEVRKNYAGADLICYLPIDSAKNARRFVDLIRPDLVLWVKYEYWYYFLRELKNRNIPLILISGLFRKDQAFFRWYGALHRNMLGFFRHLFLQKQASAELLSTLLSVPSYTVNGDTRFDRVAAIAGTFSPIPEIDAFCGNHPVIVAGSTWQEDEEELDHYANTHPDIRFIIAPHEIDEAHLKTTEQLFTNTMRFSKWKSTYNNLTIQKNPAANVLIIDNIGMLSKLYHYATIAYVGGGFGNDGIHNILEASVYGKPVFFGPVFDKFWEAIGLLEAGGAYTVGNALDLEKTMNRLLTDKQEYEAACKAALDYTNQNRGATDAILRYVENELSLW